MAPGPHGGLLEEVVEPEGEETRRPKSRQGNRGPKNKGANFYCICSYMVHTVTRMNEGRDEEVSQDDVIGQKLRDAEMPAAKLRLIRMKRSESRSTKTRYRTRTLVTVSPIFNAEKKTHGYK